MDAPVLDSWNLEPMEVRDKNIYSHFISYEIHFYGAIIALAILMAKANIRKDNYCLILLFEAKCKKPK